MRHLHFESLETRRLLTGTPEMLYRGAICSVTESRTAGVAFITDAGTLDACGRNASPQVLRRTDGTAEGSYRLGPSRTDNHIKPETIVEAGESVYFVQGNNSAGGLQTLHTAALDGSHAETLIWHQGGDTYYRSGLDRNGTYIVAQAVERLDPETGKRTLTSRLLAYTGSQKEILYDGNDRILYASRLGDVVLFTAGATLWKTNGTAEGTELVRSFPSSELSAWSMHDFRSFNGRVAISTESGIWLSDGTNSGTKLIPDSFPGSIYGFRDSLVVATFARGTHSRELQIIRDESVVDRVEIEGRSVGFALLGEHLFIKTDCQLWRTNGTPGKTALIHEHNADRCIVSATERFVYVRSDTELFQIDAVSLEVRLVHEGRSITVAAVGRDYVIYRTSTDGGSDWRILSDETGVPQDFETKIGVTIDGVSSLDGEEFVVESGDSFWITDGTRIGTRKILSLSNWNEEREQAQLDPIVYAGRFHELGDKLLFTAAADGIGITTWGTYAVDLPTPSLVGDLQGDGVVDIRDFLALSRNFGRTNALPEDGDLDGDADIDIADFIILSENFGRIR